MDRPLYAHTNADVTFDDAIEVLATQPERLLQDATDTATRDEVIGHLTAGLAGFELGREVVVDLGDFDPVQLTRGRVPLRWRAARGHLLFPTVDAALEIMALSFAPTSVQVTLSGCYHPPLGAAGAVLDRTVARGVADAVARRFVTDVAARLEAAVAASVLTSQHRSTTRRTTVEVTGSARLLGRFSPDGPTTQVLHRSARQQVRLQAFEPWQCVSAWPTDADVTVTVLEGSGELSVGDEVRHVSAGDVCVVPAGCLGAIRSGGRRLIVTEVVTPAPQPA